MPGMCMSAGRRSNVSAWIAFGGLVSPGNPLKDRGPGAFGSAHGGGASAVTHPRVIVTDIEARLGTRYTGETIEALIERYPGVRFVWLMGADNLAQFHLWQRWDWIMRTVPICVLARPGHRISARTAKAAQVFSTRAFRRRRHMACPTRTRPPGFFSMCRWSMCRRRRSGRGAIGSALAARAGCQLRHGGA
jgi:nicotinate-nucleotide adenylyltransferase